MTKLTNEKVINDLAQKHEMGGYCGTAFVLDGRVLEFGRKCFEAGAEGAAGEAALLVETWPQHCDLCNQNMESETDRIEWHGLGNCVEICDRCTGSGIEPPKADCPACHGKGKTPTGSAQVPWKLCPNCRATGKIPSGSASTAGPRPDKEMLEAVAEGGLLVTWDKDYKFTFSQVVRLMAEFVLENPFAAAPAEDAKEK